MLCSPFSGAFSTTSTDTISVSGYDSSSDHIIDLLLVAVQNYITAIILFLVVEMLMTWGFYGTFPISSLRFA